MSSLSTYSDQLSAQYGNSPLRAVTKRIVFLLLFVSIIYLGRPLFHDFLYTMLFDLNALILGSITVTTLLTLIFTPPVYVTETSPGNRTIQFGQTALDRAHTSVDSISSIIYKLAILIGVTISSFFIVSAVGVLYIHPIGWLLAGLIFIALLIMTLWAFISSRVSLNITLLLVGLLVVFLLGTWLFWAGQVQDREIAQTAMDRADAADQLPQINPDNPRIIPRMVDSQQASGTVSYQQYKLGKSDIARAPDGSLAWSYPIVPDGTRNVIAEDQRGVFLSDMTAADNRTRTPYASQPEQNLDPGQGLFLHRSASWNLIKDTYLTQYNDDPVEFVHNGDAYMAYPRTGHEWNIDFAFGVIPVPYTEPVWDGVALIDTDGDITQYSPSEAQNEPILEGQRLFPFDVTNAYLQKLGYRNGIINQYPVVGAHEDEIEIADMPEGASNQQPFLVDFADRGFGYVTAFEPFGGNTRGLAELWVVDGRTGDFERVPIPDERDVFGPERAVGLVTSEDTRTNWNRFDVVEPVPATINGELFWQTKVVPDDSLAVARNVFINAEQGTAIEIEDTNAIKQFIAGDRDLSDFTTINDGSPPGRTNGTTESPPDGQAAADGPVLVIRNESGAITDRIPLTGNTTIEITQNATQSD